MARQAGDPDARSLATFQTAFQNMAECDPSSAAFRKAREKVLSRIPTFWTNCLWINSQMNESQEASLQRLSPNTSQLILLDTIAAIEKRGDPVRIIVLKARQKGLSTGISAWIMTQLTTHWHAKAAVMAHRKEAGENLFGMYWRMFEGMKNEAGIEISKAKGSVFKRYLSMDPMDSSIQVLVADEPGADDVGETGRSTTFQYLHCSEVPFWNNASSTLKALRQCVHRNPHTAIFLESTAKAYGDVFHKQWISAFDKKQETLYVPLFIPWFVDDEYTIAFRNEKERSEFEGVLREKESDDYGNERRMLEDYPDITLEHLHWRRWKLADDLEMDLETFRREFPSNPDEAFQSTQGNWLSPTTMTRYKQAISKPIFVGDFDPQDRVWTNKPKLIERADGFVRIWDHPKPYHQYLVGSDSAEGNVTGDFSAGLVYCRNPKGIHAEIHGTDYRKPDQTEFAEQLYWCARYFNEAWINPESNYGQVIAAMLVNIIGYPNVMRARNVVVGPGALSRNPDKVGWWKCSIVEQFVQPLAKEWFQGPRAAVDAPLKYCPIAELLDEAMECVSVNGKVQAPNKGMSRRPGTSSAGFYDDRVIAFFSCLLADYALPEAPTPEDAEEQQESEDMEDMLHVMAGELPSVYSPFAREMPYGWLHNRPSWMRQ